MQYIDCTAASKIGKSKKTQTVWFPPWAKRDWSLCKVFRRRFTQRYGNQSFPPVGFVVVDWTAIRLREIDPKWLHWMSWCGYGVVRSVLSVWHRKTARFFSPMCFLECQKTSVWWSFARLKNKFLPRSDLQTHPFCRASRRTSSVRCSSRVWNSDRTGPRVDRCRRSMSPLNLAF